MTQEADALAAITATTRSSLQMEAALARGVAEAVTWQAALEAIRAPGGVHDLATQLLAIIEGEAPMANDGELSAMVQAFLSRNAAIHSLLGSSLPIFPMPPGRDS